MTDDWSLKTRQLFEEIKFSTDPDDEGKITYRGLFGVDLEDLETLRKKLIEDYQDAIDCSDHGCVHIDTFKKFINKRCGVEE